MEARSNTMTRYEYAKVIGVRTEMLARGAPPMVALTDDMKRRGIYDIQKIAEAECRLGVIPFNIVRHRPDGIQVTLKLSTAVTEDPK
jgi:DNA-directed RNA polymerase subunit K/omega